MEKTVVDEKDKAFWQSPEWYHALSLVERLAPRQAETEDIPAQDGKDVERAASRLQDWKAQEAFKDGALFTERLAQDSLSEQDLLALLVDGGVPKAASHPWNPTKRASAGQTLAARYNACSLQMH